MLIANNIGNYNLLVWLAFYGLRQRYLFEKSEDFGPFVCLMSF